MTEAKAPVAKLSDEQKVETVCCLLAGGQCNKTEAIRRVFGDGRKFWDATSRNPALQRLVAQAQNIAADALVDEGLQIVDTDPDPQRAKNRADFRRWLAGKMRPETYGERLDVSVTGSISVNDALAEARARVWPLIESQALIEPQVLDGEVAPPELHTNQPVPDEPDIFS